MNRIVTVALAAIFMVGICEVAAAAESESAKPEQRVQCTLETPVGSHLPKKVCSTAAERDAVRRQSEQTMQEARMKPSNQRDLGAMH